VTEGTYVVEGDLLVVPAKRRRSPRPDTPNVARILFLIQISLLTWTSSLTQAWRTEKTALIHRTFFFKKQDQGPEGRKDHANGGHGDAELGPTVQGWH
jgi:hypothetical protein